MRYFCKLLLIFFLLVMHSLAIGGASSNIAMKAKEVKYDSEKNIIVATGNIYIQMDKYTLTTDKIHYDIKKDVIFAEGSVRIVDENDRVIHGERAVLKDKLKRGIIDTFIAKFDKNTILVSRLANRVDNNHITLDQAVFTPCEINCGSKPIWQLSSSHTDIDYDKKRISYKHTFFEVYGIPIIYFPYFSHPTPSAPAQSGFLVPKIKNNGLVLPFYFRPKSNLDFTFSPVITKNYTLIEGEMRHKVASGQYEVHGSYGKPKLNRTQNNNSSKTSRSGRYYIASKGDFSKDNINYGFDIKRASDKAYITNYHDLYYSYLTSNIYANTINNRNYFSLEGFYFQDLRQKENNKKNSTNPQLNTSNTSFIMPSIRTQNIYSLNDSESILFNVRNNTNTYIDSNQMLFRTSLDLELMSNFITDQGHMMTFTVANRGDLYGARFEAQPSQTDKEKVWYRNIPEFRVRWRYPWIKEISPQSSIVIEPTTMVILGRKYENRFKKFELIDATKNELSENNIFNANSFSGIDIHDYGNRFSYGVNSSFMSEHLYVDAFLGQLIHRNNVTDKSNYDYVGNARLDINNNFELFYRFRRNSSFQPIRHEIGINANYEKLTSNVIYTKLYNISKNFAKEGFKTKDDKSSQLNFNINYNFTPKLLIGTTSRIDLVNKRELMRSIRMTYLFDCASISGAISDNFLQDSSRGIKKHRSKSFSIGLKVINM